MSDHSWLQAQMGDLWVEGLSPKENLRRVLTELNHFRKLMDRLSDFMIDLDEWLDEYDDAEFIPEPNAPREEINGSKDSETEAEQQTVGS